MKAIKVKQVVLAGAALIMTAGPALSAPADKLSWFNDAPFAGVGPVGAPEIRPLNPADYTSFGINLYSSRQSAEEKPIRRMPVTSPRMPTLSAFTARSNHPVPGAAVLPPWRIPPPAGSMFLA